MAGADEVERRHVSGIELQHFGVHGERVAVGATQPQRLRRLQQRTDAGRQGGGRQLLGWRLRRQLVLSCGCRGSRHCRGRSRLQRVGWRGVRMVAVRRRDERQQLIDRHRVGSQASCCSGRMLLRELRAIDSRRARRRLLLLLLVLLQLCGCGCGCGQRRRESKQRGSRRMCGWTVRPASRQRDMRLQWLLLLGRLLLL